MLSFIWWQKKSVYKPTARCCWQEGLTGQEWPNSMIETDSALPLLYRSDIFPLFTWDEPSISAPPGMVPCTHQVISESWACEAVLERGEQVLFSKALECGSGEAEPEITSVSLPGWDFKLTITSTISYPQFQNATLWKLETLFSYFHWKQKCDQTWWFIRWFIDFTCPIWCEYSCIFPRKYWYLCLPHAAQGPRSWGFCYMRYGVCIFVSFWKPTNSEFWNIFGPEGFE